MSSSTTFLIKRSMCDVGYTYKTNYNFVIQMWNDDRLQWNASDFSGVKIARIHSSQMWIPDIYLVNK